MLFNSLLFFVFFCIVTSGYYLISPKYRWAWLLLASCYFYMYFKPAYILIILFTIVVDYLAGMAIEKTRGRARKFYLIASIVTNVGVLAAYKYIDFLLANLNWLSGYFSGPQLPLLHILLPIGLSFHTFQAMSYTIEVYHGRQKAERHPGIYALYVLFYPQMVAGPIERPQHIIPQFRLPHRFNGQLFLSGILLMLTGLFKKVVIADRLGLFVDPVFGDPHRHSSQELLTATYFFAFQIYCDFSGYSDMAVGAALTLGIRLMDNFRSPYLAVNIAEFWTRWHISLSSWFRDYVYIPLGGNRKGLTTTCRNILAVFLLSGLWHGANWKYLVWGLIHGCLLIAYQLIKKAGWRLNGYAWLKWLLTFHSVCFAWIFFRANSTAEGFYILHKILFDGNMSFMAGHVMVIRELVYCALIILLLLAGEAYLRRPDRFSNLKKITAALLLMAACYFLGIYNETQFIYFQF